MAFKIFFVLLVTYPLIASPLIKGYKSSVYSVTNKENKLCEYSKRQQQTWCITTQKNPLGLYVGFNQVLVYSDNSVDAIDILRQEVKWSVSLKNVYKLHINYPVIVLFYTDRSLKAFDYFTGLQLWQRKKTSFENMMETSTNLWLVSKNMLHKLDIISGDIVEKVELKAVPNKIVGDEIHLFYQTDKGVYYFNKYSQEHDYIENTTSIKDVTSELILLTNKDNTFSLRTFSNRLVSENAQSNLIRVDSPTRSYFAFINEKNIEFIRDKKSVVYEFTTDLNSDKIDYIYRLNNKLHVFFNQGKGIWTLKPSQKQSDQGI